MGGGKWLVPQYASTSASLLVTNGSLIDTDGDGIPDAWETANGLNPNLAGDATLDRDGDGTNNLFEYLAGTNPNSNASALHLDIEPGTGAGKFLLELTTQPGRSYTVQFNDDLAAATWQSLTTILPSATPTLVQVTEPVGAAQSRRFYCVSRQPWHRDHHNCNCMLSVKSVIPSNIFIIGTADFAILGAFSNVASGGRISTNTSKFFEVWYGVGSPYGANNLVLTQAPEPSRALLLVVGLAGIAMRRRRQRD